MACTIVRQNGVNEKESGGDCAGKVGKRIKAGENASFSWLEGAKYSGDLLFY